MLITIPKPLKKESEYKMFTPETVPILNAVADTLKMNPAWLYNVIMMESAWNPSAYNKSGAVGLIQFIPKTLKDFKLLSIELSAMIPDGDKPVPENVKQMVRKEFLAKYPDVQSQLEGPVLKYFSRYKSYPTEQSVYMTVFYPSYRNAPVSQTFSPLVQSQNPGIKTVGDYIAKVQSRVKKNELIAGMKKPLSLLAIATTGLLGYYMLKA